MTNRRWLEKLSTIDEARQISKMSVWTVQEIVRWLREERGEPEKKQEKKFDPVNKPKHYTSSGIECIDVMVAVFGAEMVKAFCICNAFKYIWRHKLKNGKEDIEKAIWYLTKWVNINEGN